MIMLYNIPSPTTLSVNMMYLFPSIKGEGHITTTQAYRIYMIGNQSISTHTMGKTFGYTY